MLRLVTFSLVATALLTNALAQQNVTSRADQSRESPVDQLIPWLLDEDRQLRDVAFSEVILDTTGKHVLAVDRKNETDECVIKQISAALDETMRRMNASDSPWNFIRWDLVDLSQFKVKLKAEFQGSNRDMYRPEAIVATSAKKRD